MTREEYLRRVESALRDLPWSVRRDVLADLRDHLAELPPDTDLSARLGGPLAYAAELRDAAGLERRRGVIAYLRARRPRNLILTVVTLTVIAVALGSLDWIDSYQPLAFGDSFVFPLGTVPAGPGASVAFHNGRPFEYGLQIRNTGPFAVRVLGVPLPGPTDPFKARLFVMYPHQRSNAYRRFRPFDLEPGETALLTLRGVWARCSGSPPDTCGGTFVAFWVRYSFLWRTAVAQIRPPQELVVVRK